MKVPAWIQATIALLLVVAFIGVLFGPAIFGKGWMVPDPVMTQLLSTLVTLAVGFYLGSSQGSQAKNDQAADAQTQTIAALGAAAAAFPPPVPPPVAPAVVKIDDSTPVEVAVATPGTKL